MHNQDRNANTHLKCGLKITSYVGYCQMMFVQFANRSSQEILFETRSEIQHGLKSLANDHPFRSLRCGIAH